MQTTTIQNTPDHIILTCDTDDTILGRIEKHHQDSHIYAYNAPVSYIVKSYLAGYFFQQDYGSASYESPDLRSWMDLIYNLSLDFHPLEKLINQPLDSIQELNNVITDWQAQINHTLKKAKSTHSSPRELSLLSNLEIRIQNLTDHFIQELNSISNPTPSLIHDLYAAHNMSFSVTSLGRLVSECMHDILKTGLSGADYLSKRPILNLIHVHPAIEALSDAKHQLFEKSFTMQGVAHVSPYHPCHESILSRLNIKGKTKATYHLPHHDTNAAERWVAILEEKKVYAFHVRTSLMLGFLQFLVIPWEIFLLVTHLAINILTFLISPLCSQAGLKKFEDMLNQLHEFLSLFCHIQTYKNKLQTDDWNKKINWTTKTDKTTLLKLLKDSQNTQNWFLDIAKKISASHAKDFIIHSLSSPKPILTYQELEAGIKEGVIKPQKSQDVLGPLQSTPTNKINTIIDILEELVLTLDNTAILSFFRKYPLPATLNFLMSCATFASFQGALGSNQFLTFMQMVVTKISKAYFGKDTIEGFSNAIFGCFMYWQLCLAGTDAVVQVLENGQIDWLNYILNNPDQLVIASTFIIGLGLSLTYIPALPNTITLPGGQKVSNPFAAILNTITSEARHCLNGSHPFRDISLSFMGLKTSLLLLNFFSSGPSDEMQAQWISLIMNNPEELNKLFPYLHLLPESDIQNIKTAQDLSLTVSTYARPTPQHNLYKKLVLLQNPLIKESLKNKEFATQYFLDLHQQFQKYNAKNPNAPLDSHIILTCFYNQYCQTRLMNILRALSIVLFPIHLLQWAYGYCFDKVTHAYSGRKKCAEDLLIIAKLLLTIFHPIFQALIITWNYVVLTALRLPGFLLRLGFEFLLWVFENSSTLKNIHHYCLKFDDCLKALKLHYLLAYLIQPLQIVYANIAYLSGRYGELSEICRVTTDKIEKTQAKQTLGLQG